MNGTYFLSSETWASGILKSLFILERKEIHKPEGLRIWSYNVNIFTHCTDVLSYKIYMLEIT